MKKKFIITSLVLCLVVLFVTCERAYAQPDTLWTKTFGGSGSDRGFSVQQTTNGGYILTGHTESYGAGSRDVWLVKMDASGDTLWTKTLGGSGYDRGFSVQQTSDWGYIITGGTQSYGAGSEDVWLIKTDGAGDTVWTKTFGGNYSDAGFSVQQTADEGYIITGATQFYGAGSIDVWLIKTDESGDTVWTKTFGGNSYDAGFSVQQTSDEGYIITGGTQSYGAGYFDVWLIKTDGAGDTVWTKTFGGSESDRGSFVQQTSDGGYIITGFTSSYGAGSEDVWLIKTDSSGDTLWTKTFGGTGDDFGGCTQQTADGGYIIAGYTESYGAGNSDVWLIKTDASGDTIWTKIIGGSGEDMGNYVQQTTDGGYIIAGYTASYGAGSSDVWLIRLAPEGSFNIGSAYLKGNGRIRVKDANPVNPDANPPAYAITGNTITVEAWVFPMSLPAENQQYIIVKRPYYEGEPYRSYELNIENFDEDVVPRFSFIVTDGTVPLNGVFPNDPDPAVLGSWTHVAGVYDGSMARLYINGEMAAEETFTENIGAGDVGFFIGGRFRNERFHGLIDEVRLWNIARTQTEIQNNMNTTLNGNEPGLMGYWPLDEATEVNGNFPVTVDLTDNQNDLWVQGGTEFVNISAGDEVNLAPEFLIKFLEGAVGEYFEFKPRITGWPPSEISFISGPGGMYYDPETGTVNWTPSIGQNGYHNFTLEATNSSGTEQGTYTIWVNAFPLEIVEHNNNNVVLSVFNNGVFGSQIGEDGVGFKFNGANGLFEGDLVIAQSEDQVSGGLYIREFGTKSSIQPITSYLDGFDKAFEASYNDQRTPNPIGVSIIQRSHSKSTSPDENYVIMDYEIINNSGSDLNGIYIGLATDWDVGDPPTNLGGYDVDRKFSYIYEQDGVNNPNYYGVVALTGEISGHTSWVLGSGSDSDDYELYNRMITSNDESLEYPGDQRTIISVGPYNIPASGSVRAMFALLGGTDLTDLQTNADAALAIEFQPNPFVLSVKDVPYDQGGHVTVKWSASSLDNPVNNLPFYSIWRALPEGVQLKGSIVSLKDITIDFEGPAYRIETDLAWEWLANQPAHHFASYSYTAETLYDSTSMTDGIHYFLVSAHTNDPGVFYDSNIDSGYSVDNLAPTVPTGLFASIGEDNSVVLSWDHPVDEDFNFFKVYRGLEPDFDPTGTEPVVETIDTTYIDTQTEIGNTYYYRISAVDFHDNESDFSEIVSATIVSIDESANLPTEFALSQNYPNPFNPITTIEYSIPVESKVILKVFDTIGKEVSTLVNEHQSAGYYQVQWDASTYSSGVYFYQIQVSDPGGIGAGEFLKIRKMILIK